MFGKPIKPTIPITLGQISLQAQKLAGKLSISGVQPKLSMCLEGDELVPVAKEGLFILKPQTQNFAELPQNEYLCMQMGKRFGLNTASCLLLELADGTPAYLVKRFDRFKKGRRIEKLPCEDMHQILGGSDKYAGSHERIAKVIKTHCSYVPLDLQQLFEITIFNFTIGNSDAHQKNFSLLTSKAGIIALSPAYDIVSSQLVIPEDKEDLALTINGKRNRLKRIDFLSFADHVGIDTSYAKSRIDELINLRGKFTQMIVESTLSSEMRDHFAQIMIDRMGRLA